jgi:hypothetical protein
MDDVPVRDVLLSQRRGPLPLKHGAIEDEHAVPVVTEEDGRVMPRQPIRLAGIPLHCHDGAEDHLHVVRRLTVTQADKGCEKIRAFMIFMGSTLSVMVTLSFVMRRDPHDAPAPSIDRASEASPRSFVVV